MKEFNFCNNCGKHGHLFHQCKNPITSIGIIVYNSQNINNIKYLLIRRKDSLGYVDFMRGKYPLFNKRYLLNIINEMTNSEKNNLLTKDFDMLWNELWGEHIGIQYRGEEKNSKEKFNSLKAGISLHNNFYSLETLINSSNTSWKEPEWGFPKGRRNYQEKDLCCALREFEEETGCSKNSIKLIQNLIPIEELFTGSNYKSYKHKYYLANIDNIDISFTNFQTSEVSKIEWINSNDCIKLLRPYNLERIETINKVTKIIKKYYIE